MEAGRDGDAAGDRVGPRQGGLLSHEMESPLVVGECVVSKRRRSCAGEGIGMEETSSRKILVKRLSGLRD